ncbi:hypothetical protein FHU41_002030 [Psychromicrobium silvestre]|uniref:DoxX-like family n=1 Tax=Psychromicrobium silvestre TaxID=1645614 RepID=A0A7Y9S7P6_9MICC|nr:DoxX family protein [Psychromicrobium silvestre]NYE95780.1 hypothetical protein [Psychromicrobium silvestre]
MTDSSIAASGQSIGKAARLAGWILTGFVSLFLIFDGVSHLLNLAPVQDAQKLLGFPSGVAVPIGVVELVILALSLVPRTAVLGAVLLTGYLGGAVAAQLRIEASLFGNVLFPVYIGIALWIGLWLRDERVRKLL